MGGIFLCPRSSNEPLDAVEEKYERSLQVFDKKGLKLDQRLVRSSFVAYRYKKIIDDDEHQYCLEGEDGDFILASGTLVYNDKVGQPALGELFRDFCEGRNIDDKLLGNYCVVIFRNGQLWVLNDYYSYYPVYIDSSGTVISSSFLAVAHSVSDGHVNAHELFEFLLHGFFVDKETFFSDVYSIDSRKVWQLQPERKGKSRDVRAEFFENTGSLGEIVRDVGDSLCSYFETLGRAFGGRVGSALSGGYDTRLMLALIRKIGIKPYLHVYGDADSSDVLVAKAIADGENIALEHIDKASFPVQSPEQFSRDMESRLYFFDGLNPLGIIDDGRDISTRLDRARHASLQLNGAGGEIYREVWNLPDRRVSVRKFVKARFDRAAYEFCGSGFRPKDYFSKFEEKVKRKLGIDRSYLERNEAEMMFALLRNVFAANNNSSNNQVSHALLPFMEPRFVLPAARIPITYKYSGRFQAELIKAIDPELSTYRSSYGIDFSSQIPGTYKLKRAIERHVPLTVRLLRRKMADRKKVAWPYLLGKEYLDRIIDLSDLRVSEFIDVSKIRDPEIFTRALSIELVLNATRSSF